MERQTNRSVKELKRKQKARRRRLLTVSATFVATALVAVSVFIIIRNVTRKSPDVEPAKDVVTVPGSFPSFDIMPPVITLSGEGEMRLNFGYHYMEPGFAASDNADGDLTDKVTVSGFVNSKKLGTYIVTYSVSDSMGNTCVTERKVRVSDMGAPAIALTGGESIFIKIGDTYREPGFSATDNMDGDLSSKVRIKGKVNTKKAGRYDLTYTVSDASGNKSSATRSVYVHNGSDVADPANPGDKVVYLTFDDGPSPYTEKLLNLLDKYGIRATFFVTGNNAAYRGMIGEAYRRGHTIALHTYSHDYAKVYRSEEAYYQDLAQIRDIVAAQTGTNPTIVRFPGGTNNTVSRKYCPGIMSKLAAGIGSHGYRYCDWNVSGGDAGGGNTREAVANFAISGIQNHSVSVVLQHDTKEWSVDAVEDIITWGLSNGYTFLPLTEESPLTQNRPLN